MDNKHYIAVTGIIVKYENSKNSQSLDLGGKSSRDVKYLLTRRALHKKTFPGKWTVPGGNLEAEDYINERKDTSIHWYNVLEKVLKREIREETGLEIKNIGYVTSMTFLKGEEPMLIISLYCYHADGEVKLNEESCDFAWVSLEEAKDYDLIEGIYEELVMLDDLLKNNKENIGEWRENENRA